MHRWLFWSVDLTNLNPMFFCTDNGLLIKIKLNITKAQTVLKKAMSCGIKPFCSKTLLNIPMDALRAAADNANKTPSMILDIFPSP